MDKELLGARIREQRKQRKLTLEKFSEAVDITLVYLGEIERGEKAPSITTLIKIVNYLDISSDILLRDEVVAAKPHVFNEITEKMNCLSPRQVKTVKDVVFTLVDNFVAMDKENSEKDEY